MKRACQALPLSIAVLCLPLPDLAAGNSPSGKVLEEPAAAKAVSTQHITPTADFDANFCNFPQAWTLTKGEGVRVGVVYQPKEKQPDWRQRVAALAPGSNVVRLSESDCAPASEGVPGYQVLLLLTPIEERRYDETLRVIRSCAEKGAAVILPAYFGPMRENVDYAPWRQFVRSASRLGAIVVGSHGAAYQLGRSSFWKGMPVDIYALHSGIDGDKYFGSDALVQRDLESSAYLAAGAAALMRSHDPSLAPKALKQAFQRYGRKVSWAELELEPEPGSSLSRLHPALTRASLDRLLKEFQEAKPRIRETFEGGALDAGLLLGIKPMGDGEWRRRALRAAPAGKKATGKGVTVAILDHLFDPDDPALKGRLVKPGSVLEDNPVFSMSGHGTWMARALVEIAPDVRIMPVRICGRGRMGDADLYIKGIEYAVENGAGIISLSHQAVPKEKREALDRAVARASEKNVCFVYIHYQGGREEVIVPGPIEFAKFDRGRKVVYVVGTNFINEDAFPYTWGVSQTAPIVSGVIAMMKEINPKLTPPEIKEKLLNASDTIESGYPILNALKAIAAAEKPLP